MNLLYTTSQFKMVSSKYFIKTKVFLSLSSVIVGLIIVWYPNNSNNVCKSFDDYYSNRDANKNCYHNPDMELSVPEIVQRRGYPIETYEVVTKDGYVLSVFRIPYGKHYKKVGSKPVFLQHGVNSNSGCFVNVGYKSLAFILADAGYDVWLGNFRGTIYSLKHLNISENADSSFWNFSIHEYGAYDLPALIGMVHNLTKEKLLYIGYSLGTSSMYIYSSTYPNMVQDQIKLFISLAPCAFFGEEPYTFLKFSTIVWKIFEPILKIIENSIVPTAFFLPNSILKYVCLPYPFQMKMCTLPHVHILGSAYHHFDPETLPITLIHSNDRCSLKVWIHISQLWSSKVFGQYDYGQKGNIDVYDSILPPEYNLTNIKIPMYFIRAPSDLLNTKKDVDKLYSMLSKNDKRPEVYVIDQPTFGHFELLTAKEVVWLVHKQILKVIEAVP